jgi:hypothetical protein
MIFFRVSPKKRELGKIFLRNFVTVSRQSNKSVFHRKTTTGREKADLLLPNDCQ